MKKTLLAISILTLSCSWVAPCQASFYSPEVEKLCKADEETDNREERLRCLEEQIKFLKPLLQQTFDQVLKVSKNQRKLQKEQKEFLTGIADVQSDPKNAEPVWRLTTYEAIKAYLTVRIFELAASVLPAPKYSREIKSFCSKAQTAQEGSSCAKMQFESDEKTMQANFTKALSRTKNKSDLQSAQQEWLKDRGEACAFGAVFGTSGETYELECQDNWTRLRNAELLKMVGSK